MRPVLRFTGLAAKISLAAIGAYLALYVVVWFAGSYNGQVNPAESILRVLVTFPYIAGYAIALGCVGALIITAVRRFATNRRTTD